MDSLRLAALLVGASVTVVLSQQQTPVFRAKTEAVPLLVAVTTPAGEPVTGLTAEEFEVLDNGQRAELVALGYPATPLSLRLVMENTRRMNNHERAARDLSLKIIDGLQPNEQGGVFSIQAFGEKQAITPFTSDKRTLRGDVDKALQPLSFEPGFRWGFLSVASAISHFPPGSTTVSWSSRPSEQPLWASGQLPAVPAVIVLSPGMEYADPIGGRPSQDPVRADTEAGLILRQGTIVYGIAFYGRSEDARLAKLAQDTSGWLLEPDRKTNMAAEAARILKDLRSRYLLGFTPVAFNGQEHTLSVKVRRPGVVVRARTAYLAPRAPGEALKRDSTR